MAFGDRDEDEEAVVEGPQGSRKIVKMRESRRTDSELAAVLEEDEDEIQENDGQ